MAIPEQYAKEFLDALRRTPPRPSKRLKAEWVYFIADRRSGAVKIGSAVSVEARLSQIQACNPNRLVVLAQVAGDHRLEREIHAKFRVKRIHGEWFRLDDELLEFIGEIATVATHQYDQEGRRIDGDS